MFTVIAYIIIVALLSSISVSVSRMARSQLRDREPCPACYEQIKIGARVCPFCRSDVVMARAHPSSIVAGTRK